MMATFITSFLCLFFIIIVMGSILLASGIKKIPENEQWVVSRLGGPSVKGPGWTMLIPLVDQVVKVDMGETSTNIQDQTCVTSDRMPAILHMLVYTRVTDPLLFASQAGRYRQDLHALFASALKEMVSARPLDQILSARDELGAAICDRLNGQIKLSFGLHIEKVTVMEIVVSKEILAAMPARAELPSECPACGAPLPSQGSQSVRQLKCEYCGFLIKL